MMLFAGLYGSAQTGWKYGFYYDSTKHAYYKYARKLLGWHKYDNRDFMVPYFAERMSLEKPDFNCIGIEGYQGQEYKIVVTGPLIEAYSYSYYTDLKRNGRKRKFRPKFSLTFELYLGGNGKYQGVCNLDSTKGPIGAILFKDSTYTRRCIESIKHSENLRNGALVDLRSRSGSLYRFERVEMNGTKSAVNRVLRSIEYMKKEDDKRLPSPVTDYFNFFSRHETLEVRNLKKKYYSDLLKDAEHMIRIELNSYRERFYNIIIYFKNDSKSSPYRNIYLVKKKRLEDINSDMIEEALYKAEFLALISKYFDQDCELKVKYRDADNLYVPILLYVNGERVTQKIIQSSEKSFDFWRIEINDETVAEGNGYKTLNNEVINKVLQHN